MLIASGQVPAGVDDALVVGELSLDGVLRHTPGILSMVSLAAAKGMRRVFVPHDDAAEAALIDGVEVYPVRTLADLVNHLTGDVPIAPLRARREPGPSRRPGWAPTSPRSRARSTSSGGWRSRRPVDITC